MFSTIQTGIGGVDHVHVQDGGPTKTRQNNYRQIRNYLPIRQTSNVETYGGTSSDLTFYQLYEFHHRDFR